MPVHYDNPQEVGADRIVNSIAAFAKYGGPCIVVDFGTAINFDVVSERGEYLGGALAPGIGISADALFARAARLWRVEIRDPGKIIGTNTVHSMQAGLFYGFTDLVDGILERMKKVLGKDTRVIATGGQASADRARLAAHPADRRISHARRPAHHLGAQSARAKHAAPERVARRRRDRAPGKIGAKARIVSSAHGFIQLLQLLHGDRRVLLAQARRASAGLAARLGHRGDLAEGRHSSRCGAARHRQRV